MKGGANVMSKVIEHDIDLPLAEIVNLNLTDDAKNIIKSIKIDTTLHVVFYYDIDTLYDKIENFVVEIGSNNDIKQQVTNIIKTIIETAIKHEDEESGIIWLRATDYFRSENRFRWHRDGNAWETLEEGVYFLNMSESRDSKSAGGGAIHSEPEIQENRLFISVLPGPKNKCKEWVEK